MNLAAKQYTGDMYKNTEACTSLPAFWLVLSCCCDS